MDNNDFERTVQSLFGGMNEFVTSKTVVGEPIHVGETIILPLVDVTFGVGAGTSSDSKNPNAGGGLGGKVTPTAVLVISNGSTKMVNVKNQDGLTRILDMVPDFINRFSGNKADTAEAGETVEG
ncbi:MAG: GerW family sporulation protein [Lachnospiraceae bacterium]|nr:GerW family sporulation protein [Lachnospiraceae bacterium]